MIILEENLKWHLEAFASELFIYYINLIICSMNIHPSIHPSYIDPSNSGLDVYLKKKKN